nr:RNA-directed DNA polymerase, eukaryota [Tanacetum cinerariifolium]
MSRCKAWSDIVSKLRSRLFKWKTKTLSIGGRLTLLKSVLDASPLYCMSIFKAPKGVLKEMESIRNKSIRGGIELVQLNELRAILDSVSLSHSHDRWICNASSDGSFRVKDIRNLIDDLILPSGSVQTKWMKWWDIDWQSWSSFHTWDGWFSSIKIAPNNKKILEGVFYVAWWSIWVFRNRLLR